MTKDVHFEALLDHLVGHVERRERTTLPRIVVQEVQLAVGQLGGQSTLQLEDFGLIGNVQTVGDNDPRFEFLGEGLHGTGSSGTGIHFITVAG